MKNKTKHTPDLLGALEQALDLMESVEWNDDDIQPEWSGSVEKTRQAIVKAKGETK